MNQVVSFEGKDRELALTVRQKIKAIFLFMTPKLPPRIEDEKERVHLVEHVLFAVGVGKGRVGCGVGRGALFTEFAIDDRPVGVRWRFKGFERTESLTAWEEERGMEKDEVEFYTDQGAGEPLR